MNSNKNKEWLSNAPWWLLAIFFLVLAIVIYFIIYACFYGSGCIPPGEDLQKENWLSFLGDYLSFIGTVAVSCAALWQTKHYNDLDKKRREEDRMRSVQPVFSITITSERRSFFNEHNQIDGNGTVNRIYIENVSTNPIMHVLLFNEYQKAVLKPDDSIALYCAFSNIAKRLKTDDIISISDSEIDRNDFDMPMHLNIHYDDIDGRKMYQSFELMKIDEEYIYSLKEICEP